MNSARLLDHSNGEQSQVEASPGRPSRFIAPDLGYGNHDETLVEKRACLGIMALSMMLSAATYFTNS